MQTRRRRSVLYVPASSPRAIEKARALPCDAVILDLEDAVAPESKQAARDAAFEAVRSGGFGERELVVRINGIDTPWGADDLATAASARPAAILVPKVNRRADLRPYEQRLSLAPGIALWAMIETATSIFNVADIAAAGADGSLAVLVIGSNDLAKEAGFRLDGARRPLLAALGLIVLAARAHGLGVLDGVYNALDDAQGFAAQCAQGVEFGFDGKTLIHPSQVEPCNEVFAPSSSELDMAGKIVSAFKQAQAEGKGVVTVDGRMIENLHVEQAERALTLAAAIRELQEAA